MSNQEAEPVEGDRKRRCVQALSAPDAVMNVNVHKEVAAFMQLTQDPAELIKMLSSNYQGFAVMTNLLQDWLLLAGETDVRNIVQEQVKKQVMESFDSKVSDAFFFSTESNLSWLPGLIKHSEWRQMIYQLSESNPTSMMLSYIIKQISDAGFQDEIASVSTVANQLDVYSSVLAHTICSCLGTGAGSDSGGGGGGGAAAGGGGGGRRGEGGEGGGGGGGKTSDVKPVERFSSLACVSQSAYVYCQALLHACMDGPAGAALKRLSQESATACANRGPLVSRYKLMIAGATEHSEVVAAVAKILEVGSVDNESIQTIYEQYSSDDPPPVELLRLPRLFDVLIRDLFAPGKDRVAEETTKMVTFVTAYAASVADTPDGSDDELFAETFEALGKAVEVCKENELTPTKVGLLKVCLRHPIVGAGIVFWMRVVMLKSNFFKEFTEGKIPPHFGLLDKVIADHVKLRQSALKLLTSIFEYTYTMDVLVSIELKRLVVDRMVYTLASGHVLPVLHYIASLEKIDLSLFVHFLNEVCAHVAMPYSRPFIVQMVRIFDKEGLAEAIKRKAATYQVVHQFLQDAQTSPAGTIPDACLATIKKLEHVLKRGVGKR